MISKHDFLKVQIEALAKKHKWQQVYFLERTQVFGFYNKHHKCHIDVWSRSMKVVTCMKHPSNPAGVTALLRENIGISELEEIFINPRTHTGKGFRLDEKK